MLGYVQNQFSGSEFGKIQGQHPSYFKDSIKGYTKRIAEVFGAEPGIISE